MLSYRLDNFFPSNYLTISSTFKGQLALLNYFEKAIINENIQFETAKDSIRFFDKI